MDKRVIPILILTFVNSIGFSLLIPVLPYIIDKFDADPITYGVLMSAYPMFQFFGAPILGALSDQMGRRPVLLVSQMGTVFGWLIFAASYFMPNIPLGLCSLPVWTILLSRVVDGITGGNNSVAAAYIADSVSVEKRTKIYGLQGGIFGLGLIIGPAIGGIAGETQIEYLGTVLVALVVSIIALIYLYRNLPESLPLEKRDKEIQFRLIDEINFILKLQKYRENKYLLNILFIRVFFAFIFTAYTTIIVLFVKGAYNLSPNKLGFLFLIIGALVILNQMYIAPWLSRRIGDFRALGIGLILMIIGMPLVIFVHNLVYFMLMAYIINLGYSICMPTFRTIITQSVDPTRQGDISGIDESIFALSAAIAPLFGGYLYAVAPDLTYLIFALILLAAFAGFLWNDKRIVSQR
jgi:MFS family permease